MIVEFKIFAITQPEKEPESTIRVDAFVIVAAFIHTMWRLNGIKEMLTQWEEDNLN